MEYSNLILENDAALSNHARFLKKHGMYSAALYYKNLNESIERRAARASRYNFENLSIPDYHDGQQMMVWSPNKLLVKAPTDDVHYYGFFVDADGECQFNEERFVSLYNEATNTVEKYIVDSIIQNCRSASIKPNRCRYNHGGLHNVPDFDFVIKNGIVAYRDEIEKKLASTDDFEERMFEEGLLDVICGIENYMKRYVEKLEMVEKDFYGDKEKLKRLISALKKVPLNPAESFYEAFVACSAVMFFTNNFEPGRIDNYLFQYYEKDLKEGKTTKEEAFSLIRELLEDIEHRTAHSGTTHVTIGGTNADGSAMYNELTETVIRAIGGLRCPNVSLRVRRDMPNNIWDACLENIGKGFAQPAIVNEELYLKRLVADYNVPFDDAVNYAFGGCAEVLIQGKTTCDSTWVAYNMLDVFEHTLYNWFLTCDTFEDFYRQAKDDYKFTICEMGEHTNIVQYQLGLHSPRILKTLFVGDCIKNAKSFTKGGSRYNFDSTNVFGSTNAINSLYVIKKYYENQLGEFTKEEFLNCLINDFRGYDEMRAKINKVTKFGNYDEELNCLAYDLTDFVFGEIMKLRCYRHNENNDGYFMPAVILWVTWITCGKRVGATPDGRTLGEPLADSSGPMQGTDTEGPTSVLGAALSISQNKCAGTCVLNLRLDHSNFETEEKKAKVKALFETYFAEGGSHLQINVVDREMLEKALEDPENHKDIIVRVGGFSDNFVFLDKTIQKEILKRTEYGV